MKTTVLASLLAAAVPAAGIAADTGVGVCDAGAACVVRVAVGMPARVVLPDGAVPVRTVDDGGSGIEAVIREGVVVVRPLRRDAAARFAVVDDGGNVHRVCARAVRPVRAGAPDLEVRIAGAGR